MKLLSRLVLFFSVFFSVAQCFTTQSDVESWNAGGHPWTAMLYPPDVKMPVMQGVLPHMEEKLMLDALPRHILEQTRNASSRNPVNWNKKRNEYPATYIIDDGCLTPIITQGSCGSCWAHATSTSLSDRRCLMGMTSPSRVSEEDVLACTYASPRDGCDGGNAYSALNFIKSNGHCFSSQYPLTSGIYDPYITSQQPCKTTERTTYYTRNYVSGPYYVSGLNDEAWMEELMTNGPAYVSYTVYTSFDSYSGGVYVKPPEETSVRGGHAVRLIGWGTEVKVEGGVTTVLPYWKIANSWGTNWGEYLYPDQPPSATNTRGYFRILRGHDPVTGESECGIQDELYASVPCTTQAQCLTTCGPAPAATANSVMRGTCSGVSIENSCYYDCASGYKYRSDATDNVSYYALPCKQSIKGATFGVNTHQCVPINTLMPNGYECTDGARCASGHCVDGYCCDTACTGTCMTCARIPGACKPSSAGTDSKGACRFQSPSTCGYTGACDGSGGCEKYPEGIECKALTCPTGSFVVFPVGKCAKGVCVIPSASSYCPGNVACNADTCRTSCTMDSHCRLDYYCDTAARKCVAKAGPGGSCTTSNHCLTGVCASEGVCCDATCGGVCESCRVSGLVGKCSYVPAGQDIKNECTDISITTACGSRGVCNGWGSCRRGGEACAAVSCNADGTALLAKSVCSYSYDTCPAQTSLTCTCQTVSGVPRCTDKICSTSVDCGTAGYCQAGYCERRKANGDTCTTNEQCYGTYCVHGRCCNSACTAKTSACNIAGLEGTCSLLRGSRAPNVIDVKPSIMLASTSTVITVTVDADVFESTTTPYLSVGSVVSASYVDAHTVTVSLTKSAAAYSVRAGVGNGLWGQPWSNQLVVYTKPNVFIVAMQPQSDTSSPTFAYISASPLPWYPSSLPSVLCLWSITPKSGGATYQRETRGELVSDSQIKCTVPSGLVADDSGTVQISVDQGITYSTSTGTNSFQVAYTSCAGQPLCGFECADLKKSMSHCGACFSACTTECVDGKCRDGSQDDPLSPGSIVGIVCGCIAGVGLIAGAAVMYVKRDSINLSRFKPSWGSKSNKITKSYNSAPNTTMAVSTSDFSTIGLSEVSPPPRVSAKPVPRPAVPAQPRAPPAVSAARPPPPVRALPVNRPPPTVPSRSPAVPPRAKDATPVPRVPPRGPPPPRRP